MRKIMGAVIAIFMISLLTACSQEGGPMTPSNDQGVYTRAVSQIAENYCGDLVQTDLIAGQNLYLGTVTVSNNEEVLCFDVALTDEAVADGWVIVETHADLYESLSEFPLTKKGNPKIGQYAYDIDSNVINMWDPNVILYVSIHACLNRIVDGEVVQQETGWGDGTEFTESGSWAMYFTYTIPDCFKAPPLPPAGTLVDLWIQPATTSYTDVNLSGVPSAPDGEDPYEVWDGVWDGWCADFSHVIYYTSGGQYWYYDLALYSSYDYDNWAQGLKDFMDTHGPDGTGVEWNKINWILNNKGTYSVDDIQDAIWWFTDGNGTTPNSHGEYPPSSPNVLAQEADANGGGFLPGEDELMALIIYKAGVQIIFIEVDP